MTDIECPSCGATFPLPTEDDSDQVTVLCPQCGVESANAEAFSDSLEDLDLEIMSGTIVLNSEDSHQVRSGLELKVQAHLDLEAAMPGEGRFSLGRARTVVGRDGADITIDDPALSRSHFEVEARGDEFFIRDLDSSNGTELNEVKIETAKLETEDRIRAGKTTFVFRTMQAVRM